MPGMKSLVGMGGSGNARELAEMLRQLGRGRDTVLAHITPEEAQMLMDAGGSGDINPNTGLPEFQDADIQGNEDFYGRYAGAYQTGGDVQAQEGGFYGETPTARIIERPPSSRQQLVTTYLAPTQERALPARVYADLAGTEPTIYQPQTQYAAEFGLTDAELQPGGFYGGRAPTAEEYAAVYQEPQPGFLQTAAQGIEDTAAQYRDLARQYPTVAKMLSTGATTLPALINAIRARREAEKSAAEFRRLGEPLRAQGESLRQQALSGTLTPQQAAAQEASRARLRQQASTRGATTGTQQAMIEGQLGRTRAQLSETNLNNALKQLNLANAYDEAAIKAKLAADAEISNSVANIFANLGRDITSQAPAPQRPQSPMATQPEVTRRPDTRG
jgi:hypothetical protein